MVTEKRKLTQEEIEQYKNGEDVYNIVNTVSERISYPVIAYGCYSYKIIEENGEFIAIWERDRCCG